MFSRKKYSEELSLLINKDLNLDSLLKIVFSNSKNDIGNTDRVEIDMVNFTMKTFYSPSQDEKIKETSYQLNKINVIHLKKLIKKYNFPGWSNLPMGDLLALDAPKKTLTFYYDNSKVGGTHLDAYTINFYSRIPKDGYNYLNEFMDYILSLKKRDKVIKE